MNRVGEHLQLAPVAFGAGTVVRTGEIAKGLGLKKVLVVSDKGVNETGTPERVEKILNEAGIESVLWINALKDAPDYTIVAAATIARKEKVDGVIGVGGGSVLDSAKAIAVATPNGDDTVLDILAYMTGEKKYLAPALPVIEIPTTSGTGSESTLVAVVTSEKLDCKIGILCPPSYGIVDSELVKTASAEITGFTGMDAFSHANESLTAAKCTAHSDLLAYEAIRLIADNLVKAVTDGEDMEARDNMALASNFAGISFNESSVHIGHSIAHAIGHAYGIDHGICCANVTPAVVHFTSKHHPEKMKKLGQILGADITSDDVEVIGKEASDAVRSLCSKAKVKTFKELGLTLEQVLKVAPIVANDMLAKAYAGDFTEKEIEVILKEAWEA